MVPSYRESCSTYTSPERYRYRSPVQNSHQARRGYYSDQSNQDQHDSYDRNYRYNRSPVGHSSTPRHSYHVRKQTEDKLAHSEDHRRPQTNHSTQSPRRNNHTENNPQANNHVQHNSHSNSHLVPPRHSHERVQGGEYFPQEGPSPYSHDNSTHVHIIPTKKPRRAEQPLATAAQPASNDIFAAPYCPYDQPVQTQLKCHNNYQWNSGRYMKDDCGSGIVPIACDRNENRENWCKTPLSIYQASICELGRKLLCGEIRIPRKIIGAPPCNVCEEILRPCQGYYRKYEKLSPCEEQYVKVIKGKKVYRDKIRRYWEPCDLEQVGEEEDIRNYSGHNAYLAMKLNTKHEHDTMNF